jgi:PleD family two-component response regulator
MTDKQTILVVEDDPNLSEMLNTYLKIQGYQVFTAEAGEAAVETCQTALPNIALLDVRLPDFDGYEVARRLRAHRRTQHIPLVFLTERSERSDKIRGLELGAVDYITKPFDLQELLLRVRNVLRRAEQPSPANTITGLPEGALVDERLSNLLHAAGWAVVLVRLKGLAEYRAQYGFVDADNALRVVAQLIKEAAQAGVTEPDFVGQLDAEDFILITSAARAPHLQTQLRARLAALMDNLYPLTARLEAAAPERLTIASSLIRQTAPAFANVTALKAALQHAVT